VRKTASRARSPEPGGEGRARNHTASGQLFGQWLPTNGPNGYPTLVEESERKTPRTPSKWVGPASCCGA